MGIVYFLLPKPSKDLTIYLDYSNSNTFNVMGYKTLCDLAIAHLQVE